MCNKHAGNAGKLAAWKRAKNIEHRKKKEEPEPPTAQESESPEITFPAARLRQKAHQSKFD